MPLASASSADPVGAHPAWRPPADAVPSEPAPNRHTLAGRSAVLALVAIGAGAAGQWAIQRIADDGHANSNAPINDGIALTVALYVIVGAIVVSFVRKTHTTLRWHEGDPLAAVGAGLLRGLLLGGGIALALHAATGHLQGDSRFSDLISENNAVRILFTILLMACAAPLVEGTLFRGILLESWRSHAVWVGRRIRFRLRCVAFERLGDRLLLADGAHPRTRIYRPRARWIDGRARSVQRGGARRNDR